METQENLFSQSNDTRDLTDRPTDTEKASVSSSVKNGEGTDLPSWRLGCIILHAALVAWTHGYDVSNVANIQVDIFEHFRDLTLLPWLGFSYSVANFASLILARRLCQCFDLRWLNLGSLVIFITGAAVSGAAHSMAVVVVGRVITGIGGAIVQNCLWTYVSVLFSPAEGSRMFSLISVFWAIGLITGGVIGAAFVQNPHTTWRWSMYLNIPLMGSAFAVSLFSMPSFMVDKSQSPLWQRLKKVDFLGIILNMASVALFAVALTFAGVQWDWHSGQAIGLWIVFAVVFISWILQQTFCIMTTPEERAIPVGVLFRRDLFPVWIANGCAGAIHGIALYYTPLFFAFARGMDPFEQSKHLLPYIIVFIVFVSLTGAMLPIIGRYRYVYITAGVFILAGNSVMAATLDATVPTRQILGILALIGAGLGMCFNHGNSVANAILTEEKDRVDGSLMGNLASLGGVSISLIVAGSVFQNVGYHLLSKALQGQDVTPTEIRAALAGVASLSNFADPRIAQRILEAVSTVLAREYYIGTAAGALCLICGLLMKNEKLDFHRK